MNCPDCENKINEEKNVHAENNSKDGKSSKRVRKKTLLIIIILILLLAGVLAEIIMVKMEDNRRRELHYCTMAESDAHNIAYYLGKYFSDPSHTTMPDISNLEEQFLSLENTLKIEMDGEYLYIKVTDSSGRCLSDAQDYSGGWDKDTHTYTKRIRIHIHNQ